jgi:hypothetical protein
MPQEVHQLLVFTGITGEPHRPSSSDGPPSLSLLISYRSSSFNPDGLSVQGARRSRSPLTGYAYRLGRCGD